MAVPQLKELNSAVLEIAAESGEVLSYKDLTASLTERFSLTEADLQELLPSGQTRFYNRMGWAAGDLKRAGFLESPARGRFKINDLGRAFLRTHTGEIKTAELETLRIQRQSQDDSTSTYTNLHPDEKIPRDTGIVLGISDDSEGTPDEAIAAAYRELQAQLADEMLDSLKGVSPDRFERLVVDLLEKMGYGEGRQVGGSGDGGIDGIINQDPLGLEKVYIQAKRWQNQVGEPEIRNFSGSLEARGANKGVFITTSSFSSSATETARFISAGNKFVRLINGSELARLMIDHGVGVVPETAYVIKKLDENYFADDI